MAASSHRSSRDRQLLLCPQRLRVASAGGTCPVYSLPARIWKAFARFSWRRLSQLPWCILQPSVLAARASALQIPAHAQVCSELLLDRLCGLKVTCDDADASTSSHHAVPCSAANRHASELWQQSDILLPGLLRPQHWDSASAPQQALGSEWDGKPAQRVQDWRRRLNNFKLNRRPNSNCTLLKERAHTVIHDIAGGSSACISVRYCGADEEAIAEVPAGQCTLAGLQTAIRQAFHAQQLPLSDIGITDGQHDIVSDEDVQALQPGSRLLLVPARKGGSKAPFKERVTFNPHPKTLTMAGDYEYFAAQGQHPFAFALAELIDNALRATKSNGERPRAITVSLVLGDGGSSDRGGSEGGAGLIAVRDNGCGMTTKELNDWAVMNLSMEDRGLLDGSQEKAGSRYLSSDISFFGVGSKNAAFYLGSTVKVATRTSDSAYVHELCITGAELERRYKANEAVYEEDMVHRLPGDTSSLREHEKQFPAVKQWVKQEAAQSTSSSAGPSTAQPPAGTAHHHPPSFTRVVVSDLKPEVLAQMAAGEEESSSDVCRDLAHLYHYYLHGAKGNAFTATRAPLLPGGERLPDITIECLVGGSLLWQKDLASVCDDMESRYLKAQRATLEFSLAVPNKGTVEGVLWYFPYENDAETLPMDPSTTGRMMLTSGLAGPDAAAVTAAAAAASQRAFAPSQAANRQTQRPGGGTQAVGGKRTREEEELAAANEQSMALLQATAPLFEAFWQGRLIPGACVDTLPFVESVRAKRNAATKDKLPDQAFARIRGALFFGPSFRVTRNKLTFRDNLAQLLAGSTPSDRNLERRFKEWLMECHRTLDRSIRFERLAHQSAQALARRELGECVTIFERIHDGLQAISKDNVVKLATKPAIMGRVAFFSVGQVVHAEGCYSHGKVTVCALPEALYGTNNRHTWPLRRIEGLVGADDLEEHVEKELTKLPVSLSLEPRLKFGTGSVLELQAGGGLDQSTVAVLNGQGQAIVRAFFAGQKHTLRVTQSLHYIGPCSDPGPTTTGSDPAAPADLAAAAPAGAAAEAEDGAAAAEAPPAKKARKGSRRRKKGGDEAAAEEGAAQDAAPAAGPTGEGAGGDTSSKAQAAPSVPAPSGELLLSFENKSPIHEGFQFQRISGPALARAGRYVLSYELSPALPDGRVLRTNVDVRVVAGPAASFEVQGEGRAVAMAKPLLLGETLPPLRLLLHDAHNNTASSLGALLRGSAGSAGQKCEAASGQVHMEVLSGSLEAGGSVVEELSVLADVADVDGTLTIENLRITGPAVAAPLPQGLAVFRGLDDPSSAEPSAQVPATRGGQRPKAIEAGSTRSAELHLAIHVGDLPPQGFALKLLPGAPNSLRLLPGHPFGSAADAEGSDGPGTLTQLPKDAALAPAQVVSNETLPTFEVQVLDVWGNPTAPSAELPFCVRVECDALEPASSSCQVDRRGIACIDSLMVMRYKDGTTPDATEGPTPPMTAPFPMRMWPYCGKSDPDNTDNTDSSTGHGTWAEMMPHLAHALALADPVQELHTQLLVEPSTMPATLTLIWQGSELPAVENDGDSDTLVWQLRDVPAGSSVEGLALRCLDEAGRPAATAVKGKLQVSWAKGTQAKVLNEHDIPLPALHVQESIGAPQSPYWLCFEGVGEWKGVKLNMTLEVMLVAGPPVAWSVSLAEYTAPGSAPSSTAEERDLGAIGAGTPFYLEVEALDAFTNKCTWTPDQVKPEPFVQPLCEEGAAPLVFDHKEWEMRWTQTQSSGDVFVIKMNIAGTAGPFKLIVRDKDGDNGSSLLEPDELPMTLHAGPPHALKFDGPPVRECGMRGMLGELEVHCMDKWDNLVEAASFEVALAGSALHPDGSGSKAAKVVAHGSNRAKLKQGVARLKGVRLSAEEAGTYALRVASHSRKVAVEDGMLKVEVTEHNIVLNVSVDATSLPQAAPADGTEMTDGEAAPAAQAGASVALRAALQTADGKALPWDVAASGLTLVVVPPGGKKGDALVLPPSQQLPTQAPSETEPKEPFTAASSVTSVFAFATPELTLAGSYTVTAEYVEARPELVAALTKQEQTLRSTSEQFTLLPGPPTEATLEGPSSDTTEVTVSNDGRARRIVKAAAVQLRDNYGNACAVEGVPLRWKLRRAEGGGGDRDGAEVPKIASSSGDGSGGGVEAATDAAGRAFFGDVGIVVDTGRVAPGQQVLECQLELQAKLPGSRWAAAWTCHVTFSDDTARFAALQALQAQKDTLRARKEEIDAKVAAAERKVAEAAKEVKHANRAVEKVQKGLGAGAPGSAEEARAQLAAHRQQVAQAVARPRVNARYGANSSAMTTAINACLASGDPDLLGVFAQLGTVQDANVSAVLAAAYASALQVLVVRSYDSAQRLRKMLLSKQPKGAVPSILALTLLQPFKPETEGRAGQIQMKGMSELARRLMADATADGADPPLQMALPHTRVLAQASGSSKVGLQADKWPPGCVGYMVNLVRPTVAGHRATVLYAQLGRSLCFETMDQGAAYRQYVTRELSYSIADIFTLDHQKLSGRGVIMGSSFRVVPLQDALYRFGSADLSSTDDAGGSGSGSRREAALEALAEALEAKEAAADAAEAAAEEAEVVRAECQQEAAELEEELAGLAAQAKQHQPPQECRDGARAAGGKRPRSATAREAKEAAAAAAAAANEGDGDVPLQDVGEEDEDNEAAVEAVAKRKSRKKRMDGMRS